MTSSTGSRSRREGCYLLDSRGTAPITFNSASFFLNGGAYLGPITLNQTAGLTISPGATAGTVTANGPFANFQPGSGFPNGVGNSGDVVMTPSANYQTTLNTLTDFGSLNLTGTINLGGASFTLSTGTTIFAPGTTFKIIDNDGVDAVTGTFAGLPEGAQLVSRSFVATPQVFSISYVGGTGNDVVATAQGAATLTTTTLTSSVNPSTVGQSVTFTATVTPNSGSATPTGSVTFKDGSTTLATVPLNSSGVATFTTAALAMGTHPINAIYQANVPFVASFANVSQVVNAASGTAVPMLDARGLALLALALAAAGLFFARGSYSPT